MKPKEKLPKSGIAESCDITLETIRIHWKKLLPLFLIVVVLQAGSNYLMDFSRFMGVLLQGMPATRTASVIFRTLFGALLYTAASLFTVVAAGAVGTFLSFYLTTGGTPKFGRMFKRGFLYTLSMFVLVYMGYGVVVIPLAAAGLIGIAIGSRVLLIVLFFGVAVILLYLLLRWCLAGQMMLAHNRNAFVGLKQSWNFTKKRKWRTILALCAAFLLAGEAGSVLAAGAVLNLLGEGIAYRILASVLSAISSASGILSTPFLTAYVLREESAEGLWAEEEQLNAFLSERGV